MGVLADIQIRRLAIKPFEEAVKRPGKISYGVSSYGYDVRVGPRFRVFTPTPKTGGIMVVDPKDFSDELMVDIDCEKLGLDYVIIPPNSFALCETVEWFDIPRDVRMAMEIYSGLSAVALVMQVVDMWRSKLSGEQGGTMVDFLAGGIQFRRADFIPAQESFQAAANVASTLSERRRSLFNAAVSAFKGGDLVLYLGLLAQLEAAGGSQDATGDSAADLQLNKALESAAQHADDAEESLRTFIATRPWHPRLPEARIALAETLLVSVPPRVDEARKQLDDIRLPAEPAATKEKLAQRMDFTLLWMREISGDSKGLIADCETFTKAWPKSPLLPEVIS